MTDRALIELGYRHGVEVRDLAQDGLDALKNQDVDACRKALLEICASVDRFDRTLFASGPLQEGNAKARVLDTMAALYDALACAAKALTSAEEERQHVIAGYEYQ